ncbi:tautomerase family protein [Enterococcus sp. LJL120]
MPHIDLKISAEVPEEIRKELALAFEKDLVEIAKRSPDEISIAIEGIPKGEWQPIYDQEIVPKMAELYKKPGYKL